MSTAEDMHNSLNDMRVNFEAFLQSVFGPKWYGDAKSFALKHPFIFMAIFSICVFSAVPLLFFLGFAVITLFIALICFLCIEGSIIAIGGIVFVGVVCFISIIVVALISAIAAAYKLIQCIQTFITSNQLLCINSNLKNNVATENEVK